jgi:dipeptidyl aminopeptidase/acylaminoacyl peptidase
MDALRERQLPTAELLLDVRTPAELDVSPDGSAVAFALHATVADEGTFVPSDLYVIGTGANDVPVALTSGSSSDHTPAWSPDGTRLAFLSDRRTPGQSLPYTIASAGGEAVLAAALVGSCESVAWSADGARLLVLAADPGSYGLDWSARAVVGAVPPPDPIVRRPGDARRRLFTIDLASGGATEVGPADLSVWAVEWDGADTVVALVSSDHTGSGWYQATVARLDLATRIAETLYEPDWQLDGLSLSPDRARVAVVEGYASDHGLLSGSLRIIDVGSGAVTDPWPDLQTVGLASWIDADSLWYASTEGTGTACGRISLDGSRDERWRGAAFIGDEITTPACVITADAADIWTTHQAHGEAPELARFDRATGAWARRSAFNDHIVEGRVFPEVRVIRWTGESGVEIEGVLMTPPGAEGPLPTIVCVHGGPTWNWGSYFSDSEPNAVLLASAGYACLLPNPRGSIGRGHAFAQAVIGDGGGVDYRDIMAGVDHVIAEGIADPDRLGIAGLSYGGYMAGWAVGQSDRFAAAVAMSVVSNYVSFHLTSEVWWYDHAILEGDWHDAASQYADRSPVTHAHRCMTPTLILQGADDRCTPRSQAEELFTAIAECGTEVELVVYPREGHVPLERAHALDAIARTHAWFDAHLSGVSGGAGRTS